MRGSGYAVAVFGATGVVGRALQSTLREREFPVSEWRLFDSVDRLGDAADEDWEVPLLPFDRVDLGGVDLVFMCTTEVTSVEWTPRAVAAGAVVIDLTQAFADQPDVPIVVPEVNPGAVAEHRARGVLTSPVAGATALSVVLKPLDAAAQLKRVVAACYESVSSAGDAAVEELAQQCRDLLSGRSAEASVFPHRIAFNVIPQVGELLSAGKSRGEWQIESQTRRVLELEDLPITVTSVWVPTFFGQGYALNVETEQPLDAAEACAILRSAPGVLLTDDSAAQLVYPTLIDALDTEATYVGRVRDDPTVPSGLNLWLAIDGVRKGGAVNAVQIAELIIRDYL